MDGPWTGTLLFLQSSEHTPPKAVWEVDTSVGRQPSRGNNEGRRAVTGQSRSVLDKADDTLGAEWASLSSHLQLFQVPISVLERERQTSWLHCCFQKCPMENNLPSLEPGHFPP